MTISVKHAFTSAKSDGTDATQVQPSNWNAEHNITLAADKLLGRDSSGAGAVQEISCTSYGRGIVGSADVSAFKTNSGIQGTAMTWTAAHVHQGKLEANQDTYLTGVISPTGLVGDTNDWAPTSFSTSNHVRMTSSADCSLTGLAGGAEGRMIVLDNVGSYVITLKNASASSIAANRFLMGQDIQLRPNDSVVLIYDATSSRWRFPTKSTTKAPTVQKLTSGSSATYTTPAGVTYLRVRMVGPGGGGAGSGTASWGAGGNGGSGTNTSFGSTTAVYGQGAPAQTVSYYPSAGGAGGSGGTTGTGTEICRFAGVKGGGGSPPFSNTNNASHSGAGGNSVFGGAGGQVVYGSASSAGNAAAANSGSGGSSAYYAPGSAMASGGGGGAGEYVEFYIYSPAATYSYTVPAGGSGGTAGTSGAAGGAGGAGVIIVEEFYS